VGKCEIRREIENKKTHIYIAYIYKQKKERKEKEQ
jgi:hypothetical protein